MSRKWFCHALLLVLFVSIGLLWSFVSVQASPLAPAAKCDVPGDHATIAAALADPNCAVINLAIGAYPENLVIDRDVVIAGADDGPTVINGGALDRVILITDTATVTITDVIITNGLIVTGPERSGGGIFNYDGDLLLVDSRIVSNTAFSAGGLLNEQGEVTLMDVDVVSNTAAFVGGGVVNGANMFIIGGSVMGNVAALNGGGIQNEGNMEILRTLITHNLARGGAGVTNVDGALRIVGSIFSANTAAGGSGGGLRNSAQSGSAVVQIGNSMFIGNRALASAGGGGIANAATGGFTATVVLRNSRIELNLATPDPADPNALGVGGGIFNGAILSTTGGTAHVDMAGVIVIGNAATNGAGIASATLDNPIVTLRVDIADSAIVSNTTLALTANLAGNGGGILNFNSVMQVANSTISGNAARGTPPAPGAAAGLGGGIANAGTLRASTVQLINTTVANNQANVAGGGIATLVTAPAATGTGTALVNTIVAGNTAGVVNGNCFSLPGGLTVSAGNNIEDQDTCNLTQATDKPGTEPLLGPLAGNGGDTLTHALIGNSPAINAGNNAVCAAPPVNGHDQRGMLRPLGPACDVGAFEAGGLVRMPLILMQP